MTTTRWLLAVGVITASVTTGALATPAQAHGGPTIVRPWESTRPAGMPPVAVTGSSCEPAPTPSS